MSAIEKAIPGETGQGYADFATFQDPLPSLPGAKKVNSYPEYDSSLTVVSSDGTSKRDGDCIGLYAAMAAPEDYISI